MKLRELNSNDWCYIIASIIVSGVILFGIAFHSVTAYVVYQEHGLAAALAYIGLSGGR